MFINDLFNDKDKTLNEVSNELLGRYKKAAGADASAADKRGDVKRGDKRFSGIVNATKKQLAHDVAGHKKADVNEQAPQYTPKGVPLPSKQPAQQQPLNVPQGWEAKTQPDGSTRISKIGSMSSADYKQSMADYKAKNWTPEKMADYSQRMASGQGYTDAERQANLQQQQQHFGKYADTGDLQETEPTANQPRTTATDERKAQLRKDIDTVDYNKQQQPSAAPSAERKADIRQAVSDYNKEKVKEQGSERSPYPPEKDFPNWYDMRDRKFEVHRNDGTIDFIQPGTDEWNEIYDREFPDHPRPDNLRDVYSDGNPVAEAGPFSYGAKKPKKGSVADLAAKKRKEQEQGKQPVEPRDQRVGVARVVKEYGDTPKGQKMLTKVHKRAVDRLIKADDKNRLEPDYTKRDLKTVRKNQATADRAWDRFTDMNEQGVAEGNPVNVNALMSKADRAGRGAPWWARAGDLNYMGDVKGDKELQLKVYFPDMFNSWYFRHTLQGNKEELLKQAKALGMEQDDEGLWFYPVYRLTSATKHEITKAKYMFGDKVKRVKPEQDMAEGSVQDKLHRRHQELRKKSGLPDPNYYKELKATYDLPDEERYAKAAELKKKYQVKEARRAEANFDVEDLKRLEQIRDLPTLKAQAMALISKPSERPMKPEKVAWFDAALDRMDNRMAIIKLMYDLLLSGEGHQVIGSKRSMNPNSYRSRFGESTITNEDVEKYVEELERAGYDIVNERRMTCPECGGAAYADEMLAEKQDACYHKVKSRYKVWPSAYASGALVRCRKKGAKNWGNKSKK